MLGALLSHYKVVLGVLGGAFLFLSELKDSLLGLRV